MESKFRYSILPAISLDGDLHLDILTRSWTADEFPPFVEVLLGQMNPYPQKNSVLVLDNASAHHFDDLRGLVEDQGMCLCYLPPMVGGTSAVQFSETQLINSIFKVRGFNSCNLIFLFTQNLVTSSMKEPQLNKESHTT